VPPEAPWVEENGSQSGTQSRMSISTLPLNSAGIFTPDQGFYWANDGSRRLPKQATW